MRGMRTIRVLLWLRCPECDGFDPLLVEVPHVSVAYLDMCGIPRDSWLRKWAATLDVDTAVGLFKLHKRTSCELCCAKAWDQAAEQVLEETHRRQREHGYNDP